MFKKMFKTLNTHLLAFLLNVVDITVSGQAIMERAQSSQSYRLQLWADSIRWVPYKYNDTPYGTCTHFDHMNYSSGQSVSTYFLAQSMYLSHLLSVYDQTSPLMSLFRCITHLFFGTFLKISYESIWCLRKYISGLTVHVIRERGWVN